VNTLEGERNALKAILQMRFPELNLGAAIQSIDDLHLLTDLKQKALTAPTPAAITEAIEACTRHQA